MKLLLVDDEPGIREGLAALLRRKGHEVVTAGDCARADELIGGAAADFDLVLTDWHLPDGVAEDYLAAARCPAVAMTGHPDEIEDHPALTRVLTKPVSPGTLLQVIAEIGTQSAPEAARSLPADVAALVSEATVLLGGDRSVQDDGTFVVLRAALPDERRLDDLRRLGGDLRVLAPDGNAVVEVRWCRDGRPDPGVPVVGPEGEWPTCAEFAVDFDGTELPFETFGRCIDRAAEQRECGRTVHFLNVPDSLLSWASSQGKSDDMPMKAPVGPRLPEVLADLWS